MSREHEPCALCARFTRQGHAAEAANGRGWCVGYERYVHATGAPTPLFKPAPADQIAEREAFLEQYKEHA